MPGFMRYMNAALIKYKDQANVYCINSINEPVDVPQNGFDAYFMGRINSWGWGTWRDKWLHFERNYR
jgi:hypothetical protein